MTVQSEENRDKLLLLRARQGLITLGPILITISLGLAEGYSAVLLPQLEADPEWNIDTNLSSWIASIATLPMSVGCILGGWLTEAIGRKMLHLVTCVPNLIGWMLIGFSGHSVPILLAGRFITGMCVGVLSPVLMVYIAETSDPVFRGILLPSISLALNLGIALAHVMGTYLEWRLVAFLACIYPTACFTLMMFVPESPVYLIKNGRIDEARKHFLWIRGFCEESQQELNVLISRYEYESSQPKKSFTKQFEVFKKPEFYKPLWILIIFFSTMQWAGINPIAFYTVNILQEVFGDADLDAYISMIIMDAVRIFASVLGCFAQKYIARRPMMMISCAGTVVSSVVLSLYSFFIKNSINGYSWIALLALVSYVLFVNIGLLSLSYSMSGELFAQSCRGLGSGIVTLYNMVLMFILVKITPFLFKTLKTGPVFLTFGICCFIGMIALIILLPETKDKPLHEIEDRFKGVKNSK